MFYRFILQSKEVIHSQLLEKQKIAEEKIKELEVSLSNIDNSNQLLGKSNIDNSNQLLGKSSNPSVSY
jgi:hypothetical protein